MSADCFTRLTGRKKHGYSTKVEAFKKSQEIQAAGGKYLRPYLCPCGNYHLTGQKRKNQ